MKQIRQLRSRLLRAMTLTVHVAFIEHRHGHNMYAALTHEGLYCQLADYCREYWYEVFSDLDLDPHALDDDEAVHVYFGKCYDEFYSADEIDVGLGWFLGRAK